MVEIWVEKIGQSWFGLAWHGGEIIATTVESSRERASVAVERNLPAGTPRQFIDEGSVFARDVAGMLAEIEAGDERNKRYVFSREYLPERLRGILLAAAAIPAGYVTTYGSIAGATGTVAREVGRVMATNPLYPIVPCHRVVGADLSLVGYGGRQDHVALRAKLDRLRAEAHGFVDSATVTVDERELELFPVEWVIRRASEMVKRPAHQLTLFPR